MEAVVATNDLGEAVAVVPAPPCVEGDDLSAPSPQLPKPPVPVLESMTLTSKGSWWANTTTCPGSRGRFFKNDNLWLRSPVEAAEAAVVLQLCAKECRAIQVELDKRAQVDPATWEACAGGAMGLEQGSDGGLFSDVEFDAGLGLLLGGQ